MASRRRYELRSAKVSFRSIMARVWQTVVRDYAKALPAALSALVRGNHCW